MDEFAAGYIDRRGFLRYGALMGISLPMLGILARALGVEILTPRPARAAGNPGGTVRLWDDTTPVYVYAGEDLFNLSLNLIKPARLEAGNDIDDVNFVGQNNSAGDITSIIAGRDITSTDHDSFNGLNVAGSSSYQLYGPGVFFLEAGRDLGPFNTDGNSGGGIKALGDGSNSGGRSATVLSYLPSQGADITALFGVGPGIDYQAAIDAYVNPGNAGTGGIDYLTDIAGILGQDRDQAWATFQALPQERQDLLIDRAFLDFLAQVGADYRDPASPYAGTYNRAYTTIETLFPAAFGYTDNTKDTGQAATQLPHGDLRMARSLLETTTGGDIDLIGPGGNIYVGSNQADSLSPASEGILTLQGGTIRTFTDGDVQIFQSRIFTEQVGDVDMFSANGDLNAGKGPKSSSAYPPLQLIVDSDGYMRVSPVGLVTGAGIGALLSVPGQDPTKSNALLMAPHGTVDAGAAGIRVAGNLDVIARLVLNSFNIQVGGTATGIFCRQARSSPAMTTKNGSPTCAGAAPEPAASSHVTPTCPATLIVLTSGVRIAPVNDPWRPHAF